MSNKVLLQIAGRFIIASFIETIGQVLNSDGDLAKLCN